MAQLFIPTPLRKYTDGQRVVETQGATLREMLDAVERDAPGFKFRIVNEQGNLREHIHLFINNRMAPDLDARVQAKDEVRIILAISGGARDRKYFRSVRDSMRLAAENPCGLDAAPRT